VTGLWLCRCAQTSAAVLLVGTAVLRLLAGGTGLHPAACGWRRLAWTSGCVLLLAAALQLVLTAAEMSDLPLARTLTGGAIGEVLGGTRFGTVWQVRVSLLGGWFVLTAGAALTRRDASRIAAGAEFGAGLVAIALLGSLVFAGHAQASAESAWLLPNDLCHVLAAGAWPGGLLPLALLLAKGSRNASLLPAALTITRRFSRLSVFAVCVLAGSGVLNGVGMVGSFAALSTSGYGRLILCKATLLSLMICVGTVNRKLVRRQESRDAANMIRALWRNVSIETALAIGVLLATEALAMSAPPAPAG
jgi:putative copper resistance protein D